MQYKLFGAVLIIVGCGGVGFKIAASFLREERNLRSLYGVLEYMSCQLQYRLTPLPRLCRQASAQCKGAVSQFFSLLSGELEAQISPEVGHCVHCALDQLPELPTETKKILELLGGTLGKFDLDGQLRGISVVQQECNRLLTELSHNRQQRMRSYQTLGLCAGAALVILFI